MTKLDASHRRQIEALLGRRLSDVDLAPSRTLPELSATALEIARQLARQQRVLCALFLRALLPIGLGEAKVLVEHLVEH